MAQSNLSSAKIALVLTLSLQLPRSAVCGNHYCDIHFPATEVITKFEGKFNVPQKPLVEPGKVLFLWPGVNPVSGQGGMMQVGGSHTARTGCLHAVPLTCIRRLCRPTTSPS